MWWLYALVAGCFQSARNVLMKDIGAKIDPDINVWGRFLFTAIFSIAFVIWQGIPTIAHGFWLVSGLAAIFVSLATWTMSQAFHKGEFSMTTALFKIDIPLLAILGTIFMREQISYQGLIGITVVFIGVYLLNIEKAHKSILEPILLLYKKIDLRYALATGILLAPTILFFKQSVLLSDPYFAAAANYVIATLFMTPFLAVRSRKNILVLPKYIGRFIALGFLGAMAALFSHLAYQIAPSAYVEAIKQSEFFFSMILAIVVFGEKSQVKEIWPACLVVLMGILILILS